ncbi:DUF2635 domain-containing protein [Escherichia coli]|uniref:DUF2635 domain-containing protein n=1 Tax=uncultured Escherichia sp. TaxID=237777 RepID=UPI00107C5E87|nr:DUF2635 domain-containing protein [Escherichia coli]EAA0861795.1 hypothetical protein [Shigella sonnei]EFP8477499.1 DUF2635 domain-containing protein [Shigella boydii]EKG8124757.1 DUF2635 domain-containing protein [Shigella flexneri]EFG6402980.1 DUF2635 domain-containing protein [Escherichia coli]EFG8804387.1 DUF2635 domain-containing protein [Escherichia coli]
MTTIFIKPAPGCLIRDPDTMKPLAQEGEEKTFTPFWCRRLNDGDVIVVEKAAEAAPAAASATTDAAGKPAGAAAEKPATEKPATEKPAASDKGTS